ncbi:hypothetical protein F4801DRAFT_115747 [Xylaria longipes]|nr:hypothetical protein F4801DRAFT_115747 [Xylaria longipes]RYC60877.1 hypothetical protein CHU98_g5331 [Xylaria longipes]
MKASFASTLASLPLLAIVSAFEVPWYEKLSLGDANCQNFHLKKTVLHATCKNPARNPDEAKPVDLSLDLNTCFANYLGTLNYVSDGGYGSSCSWCHLVGTKLVCMCSVGGDGGTKYNEYELNNWRTIRLTGGDFTMHCGSTEGLEKRVDNKEARPFVA